MQLDDETTATQLHEIYITHNGISTSLCTGRIKYAWSYFNLHFHRNDGATMYRNILSQHLISVHTSFTNIWLVILAATRTHFYWDYSCPYMHLNWVFRTRGLGLSPFFSSSIIDVKMLLEDPQNCKLTCE